MSSRSTSCPPPRPATNSTTAPSACRRISSPASSEGGDGGGGGGRGRSVRRTRPAAAAAPALAQAAQAGRRNCSRTRACRSRKVPAPRSAPAATWSSATPRTTSTSIEQIVEAIHGRATRSRSRSSPSSSRSPRKTATNSSFDWIVTPVRTWLPTTDLRQRRHHRQRHRPHQRRLHQPGQLHHHPGHAGRPPARTSTTSSPAASAAATARSTATASTPSSTTRTAPPKRPRWPRASSSLTGLFSDGQVQMIMRGLAQKKGADIMTAPSVTAQSGQKATIEIIREFIYPTEYEPPELPNQVGGDFGGVGGRRRLSGGGGGRSRSPRPPRPRSKPATPASHSKSSPPSVTTTT